MWNLCLPWLVLRCYLWKLRHKVLRQLHPRTHAVLLLVPNMDLLNVRSSSILGTNMPNLRGVNSCGPLIADPLYQRHASPQRGVLDRALPQIKSRQKGRNGESKGTRTGNWLAISDAPRGASEKPQTKHLGLAKADSEPDWPMPNRLPPFVLERGHEVR